MDHRSHPRVPRDAGGFARVQFRPGTWSRVQFSDLGSGGCRFKASRADAGPLVERALLPDWTFAFPSLADVPIPAQVVWCRPDADGLEAGVRFLDVPLAYGEALDQLVASLSRSTTPLSALAGLPS